MTDNQDGTGINGTEEKIVQTALPNAELSDDAALQELNNADETSNDTVSGSEGDGTAKRRTRGATRPFPPQPFEEALTLALAIQQYGGGRTVRRTTLFETLQKSIDSSSTREWISAANRYGLIKGNYTSEYLELTEEGETASGDSYSKYEQTQIWVNLAIFHIPAFKSLYDELVDTRFPARQFLEDIAEKIVDKNLISEFIDIFIVNVKFVGLLRVIAGVERLVSLEHLLDTLSAAPTEKITTTKVERSNDTTGATDEEMVQVIPATPITIPTPVKKSFPKNSLDDVCFYVSPIGEPSSEQRQHSDLFLEQIIRPALEGFNLRLVRADGIDKSGIIGKQIVRHLLLSKLVIADLSFHNPNVFYELALRHASRLPTVHITRSNDPIPFDVNQMRTIKIDTSSIYTLIPQMQSYKAEIAAKVRSVLEDPDDPEISDNPLSIFYPSFRATYDK